MEKCRLPGCSVRISGFIFDEIRSKAPYLFLDEALAVGCSRSSQLILKDSVRSGECTVMLQ